MSDRGFGYGIIGCGWVAPAHAWGVRAMEPDDVRLIAVADQDLPRAQGLARQFDVPHAYADYRRVLEHDDVHAVSICLPDFLHHEAVLAAAAAGKHVLCEKPLALDLGQADEMVRACERRGVALSLVMNHRYFPDNIRTKRAIREGELGRILLGSVLHSSALTGDPSGTSPWRGRRGLAAGGILTTQAIHFLDLLLWFAGPARAVKAWAGTLVRTEQDYEDTAALALQLRSGALATLATTNGAPITDDFTGTRVEIHGTDGYIVLEGDRLRLVATRDGGALPEVRLPALPAGAQQVIFGLGHAYEIMDFVTSVRRGGSMPVPGRDGRHLLAVLSAAYRSAAEGKEVVIEDHHAAYADRSGPAAGLFNPGPAGPANAR
ncbi:MAG TPA: Gfo/Idh/MocA family oxidoreductase [bacterium]|nr:Gfo/Idh/MocA family oxidoreductase [bacterium]